MQLRYLLWNVPYTGGYAKWKCRNKNKNKKINHRRLTTSDAIILIIKIIGNNTLYPKMQNNFQNRSVQSISFIQLFCNKAAAMPFI